MRTRPTGFTLIELMVVMTTIGLLASVALPSFQQLKLRSKQAERALMSESIRRAIDDYSMREGRYPQDFGAGMSFLNLLTHNPVTAPGTQKRPFRLTRLHANDHWNRLSLVVEGNVYYSYWGYGLDLNRVRLNYVYADGDLDGDGVVNQIRRLYYYQDGQLIRFAGAPADGKASEQVETPAAGMTF